MMKNTLLPLFAATAVVCLCLSGCTSTDKPTADQIVASTLAAMRNVTSYYFTMNETMNTTNYNGTKATNENDHSLWAGRINVTRKEVAFEVHVTKNDVPQHQIFYLVANKTYIGNETNGNISWLNTSAYTAKMSWMYWSRLDFDAEVLSGESRMNPSQRTPVNPTRKPDTTYNHTACYVISITQSGVSNVGHNMNQTDTTIHTYYIDKATYHIVAHYATRTADIKTDATTNPPFRLIMDLTAKGTVTYYTYNTKVTIQAPYT